MFDITPAWPLSYHVGEVILLPLSSLVCVPCLDQFWGTSSHYTWPAVYPQDIGGSIESWVDLAYSRCAARTEAGAITQAEAYRRSAMKNGSI